MLFLWEFFSHYTGDLYALGGPFALGAAVSSTAGNIALAGPVAFTLSPDGGSHTTPVSADGTAVAELTELVGSYTVSASISSPYHVATPATATVLGDIVPPVTAATVPAANDAGWHNAPVTIALEAMDPEPGSGLDRTEVSLDGGVKWSLVTEGGLTVAEDGIHTVAYRSADKAGNVEADQQLVVKIDTLAPAIALSEVTDGDIYEGEAAPVWTVADDLSGVAGVVATLDGQPWESGTAITEAGEHVLLVTAADVAGNYAEAALSFSIFHTPTAQVVGVEGQYSDHVSLKATLQDGDTPVSGATVSFQVGDITVGSAVTNTAGAASVAYKVALPAGTYPVT
ncbi:MAG TPA: hypothetical protein VD902_05115 [Symbiobacteriaceae bacterium]|nr:hypothetical protein [Symbiobacteriaceae bacterium]